MAEEIAKLGVELDSTKFKAGGVETVRSLDDIKVSAGAAAGALGTTQSALDKTVASTKAAVAAGDSLSAAQRQLVAMANQMAAAATQVDLKNKDSIATFSKEVEALRALATQMESLELVQQQLAAGQAILDAATMEQAAASTYATRAMAMQEIQAYKMDAAMGAAAASEAGAAAAAAAHTEASVYNSRAMALQEVQAYKMNTAMDATKASVLDVGGALTTLAGIYAGMKIAEWDKGTLDLAARYQTLGVVMEVVGRNAGYNSTQMAQFQNSLTMTGISMVEARNNLSRMAAAQLDLTKSSQLARMAQDAAVLAGINSSEAFERIVQSITSGQVRILHTMDIYASYGQAEKQWAEQHDRTTNSLTQQEKAQIRLSAVLEEGSKRAGAYEAAMGTVGKEITSTQRYLEDMRTKAGTAFLPEYTSMVKDYADALKYLGANASIATGMMVGLGSAIVALGITLKASAVGAFLAGLVSAPVLVTIAALATLATVLGAAAADAALARRETQEFNETLKHLGDESLRRNIAKTAEKITNIQMAMYKSGQSDAVNSDSVERLNKLIALQKQYQDQLDANKNKPAKPTQSELDDPKGEKFKALMEQRNEEVNKQRALNAAFGESATALKALEIQYDATIKKSQDAKVHKGAELDQLNRATDAMAHQRLVALELADSEKQANEMRDAGHSTEERIRLADQERQMIGLSTTAAEKQKIANDALNATVTAKYDLEKALQHADANSATTALAIYDNTLLRIDANKRLAQSQMDLHESQQTQNMHERVEALLAENEALQSGETVRKDYQANLKAEMEIRKAVGSIPDPFLLVSRLVEIERLREAEVAHNRITESIEKQSKAEKSAADETKKRLQDLDRTLRGSIGTFFSDVLTKGKDAFTSLFDSIRQGFIKLVADMVSARMVAKITGQSTPSGLGDLSQYGNDVADASSSLSKKPSAAQGYLGAAVGGFGLGYGIGQSSYSGNRSGGANYAMGALGGAAAGAAMGGMIAGPPGAAIGAVVGFVGGLMGVSKAAGEAEKSMAALQKTLTSNIENIRATIANDSLAQAIAQVKDQFNQLRQQTEDAYAYGKNEVKRNEVLSDLNQLEAARIDQLQKESALQKQQSIVTIQIRYLQSQGLTEQAAALQKSLDHTREYNAAVKDGLDETTLSMLKMAQAAEDLKAKADALAQATQAMEDLDVRMLRSHGLSRMADDLAFKHQQEREYNTASSGGASPEYMDYLRRTQKDEAEFRKLQQSLDDQTQAINDNAAALQASIQTQINITQDQLKAQQDLLSKQTQEVALSQKTLDSLSKYANSLALNSTLTALSPMQQLDEARRQYATQLSLAMGGDKNAAANISQAADARLQASLAVNAKTKDYIDDYNAVQEDVIALQAKYGTQLSIEQQQLQAIQSAVSVLQAQLGTQQAAYQQAMTDAQAAIKALQDNFAQQAKMYAIISKLPGATDPGFGLPPGWQNVLDVMGNVNSGQTQTVNRLDSAIQLLQGGFNALASKMDEVVGAVNNDANSTARAIEGIGLRTLV